MALINCPECTKEISDTIKKCPNCGYKFKKKLNKQYISILAILLIIVLITGIILLITQNTFSANEKYAIECTNKLKNYMKSPDSFKLQNDCLLLYDTDFNRYLLIEYTSANSYGASLKGIALFKGYTYLGEYDYEKDDFDDNDAYFDFQRTKVLFAGWKAFGNNYNQISSSDIIKAEKIGKKLKINYVK